MICKLNYQWTTFTFQISLVLYGSSNWNKAMHNAFSAIECQSVAIRTAICVWRSLWKSCPNLADVEKDAEKKQKQQHQRDKFRTQQWQMEQSPPGFPCSILPETPGSETAVNQQRCMPLEQGSSPARQHCPAQQQQNQQFELFDLDQI